MKYWSFIIILTFAYTWPNLIKVVNNWHYGIWCKRVARIKTKRLTPKNENQLTQFPWGANFNLMCSTPYYSSPWHKPCIKNYQKENTWTNQLPTSLMKRDFTRQKMINIINICVSCSNQNCLTPPQLFTE